MGPNVFANGRAISCKAASGKAICAFPDVCLTPPAPPAGPIPIPYPNTAFASDATGGSKNVKIGGKEVMLRNSSHFKKSTGDEAATKAQGMGVITHQIQGKVYFNSWSMDVKVEGANAVRHLDLTTHNHASQPGQTPPWPYVDSMAIGTGGDPCEAEKQEVQEKCDPEEDWQQNCPTPPAHPGAKPSGAAARAQYKKDYATYMADFPAFAEKCEENPCLKARKCMLVPYKPSSGCCPGQTGDHVIDAASFLKPKSGVARNKRERIDGWDKYDVDKAPCICAEGPNQTTATHGQLHTRRGVAAIHNRNSKGQWSRQTAASVGAKAITKTFPSSDCSQGCLEAQINAYHDGARSSDPEKPIKAQASMTRSEGARAEARVDMGIPSPGAASSR